MIIKSLNEGLQKKLGISSLREDQKIENNFIISEDGKTLEKYIGKNIHVSIPEGIEIIGDEAFYDSNIKSCKCPSTLKEIYASAFSDSSIEKIFLNEGLKEIGLAAFNHCLLLTKVVIPTTVDYISEAAFADCDLKSITFSTKFDFSDYIISDNPHLHDIYYRGTFEQWLSLGLSQDKEQDISDTVFIHCTDYTFSMYELITKEKLDTELYMADSTIRTRNKKYNMDFLRSIIEDIRKEDKDKLFDTIGITFNGVSYIPRMDLINYIEKRYREARGYSRV